MSDPQMPADDQATRAALAVLAEDVGAWTTELTITPYPGAEPVRTTGVADGRLVAGRWLVTDQATESGFAGHGVYGWDPTAGTYVCAWVDAVGGGIARGTGTWDPGARTMTYDITVDHEGRTLHYREVTERHPDGTRTYHNLQQTADGTDHETIRATFRPR
jgi:hypothetical protein